MLQDEKTKPLLAKTGYLRYRQKSADAFEKYVRQKLPQAFTEQQLQFYKQGIYDSYSTSPPQYVILRSATILIC